MWRQVKPSAPLLILAFLAAGSSARNNLWREEVLLWNDSAAKAFIDGRPVTNKAAALNRLERHEEAIAEYRIALQKNQDNHFARSGLAFALFQLGRFTEAASEYRRAIKSMDIPQYHENLAMALEKTGAIREAVGEISALVTKSPDDIVLRAYLLTLLYKIGERESYLSTLIARRRSSGNPRDLFESGWACAALERNREAVGYLRRALASLPDFPAAHYFLGLTLGRLGMTEEAIEHMKTAMGEPLIFRSAEAHYNMGILYQMIRETSKAESEYLRALEREPANSQALNNLGALHLSLGKKDDALREFQAAVKADPKNAEARKNLSLLTGHTLSPETQ